MNTQPDRPFSDKPLYLFLLPLFFVLHGYTEHFRVVYAGEALLLLGKYLAVTALLYAGARAVLGRGPKPALFAGTIMGFHFFFGALHDTAKSLLGNGHLLVKYSVVLPLVLIAFLLFCFFLRRTNRSFTRLTRYANLVLALFLLLELLPLYRSIRSEKPSAQTTTLRCDTCARPDVYLIIADEYASERELREVLHFDNSPFIRELEKRGFNILDESKSNYNSTPYAMASLLTMDYLHDIRGTKENTEDLNRCYSLINQNATTRFFSAMGYQFVNHSVFRFNDQPPPVNSMFLTVGEDLITAQTFLGRLDRDIRFNLVTRFKIRSEMEGFARRELNNTRTLYNATIKVSAAQSSKPRFIYTHLMMPHFPYYLDRHGRFNNLDMLAEENWFRQKEYLEYLQYSNGQFLQLIDTILRQSAKPPVILFMGDHGFRHLKDSALSRDYLYMNLNAVYLPGVSSNAFPDTLTLVNQFRYLLNQRFGQSLPLQRDSLHFLR
jgi:hypothetical protein